MTLNLSLVSPSVVYQSADFKLTDVRTGRPRPYVAQKSIIRQGPGWTALIAFSGIGSARRVEVADWLADVTGPMFGAGTFDELLKRLTTAEQWLTQVPKSIDRRHTFSVVGFEGLRPVIALVSNWQSLDGPDQINVGRRFRITKARPRETRLYRSGSGAASVSLHNRARLVGGVRSGLAPGAMLELLATTNEEVSLPNRTVSAGCFAAWTTSTGSGGGRAFGVPEDTEYLPRFAIPPNVRLQPKMNPDGAQQPVRLVQMATVRNEPTEAFHRARIREAPEDPSAWNNFGAFQLDGSTRRSCR